MVDRIAFSAFHLVVAWMTLGSLGSVVITRPWNDPRWPELYLAIYGTASFLLFATGLSEKTRLVRIVQIATVSVAGLATVIIDLATARELAFTTITGFVFLSLSVILTWRSLVFLRAEIPTPVSPDEL